MAINYVRADITTLKVDAIVNTANPLPVIGGGTDSSIYEAAGKERLLKERKKIGSIDVGDAKSTSGFDLCRIIIHTVGPRWNGGNENESELLRSCYKKSLELAKVEQCRSIAFPLISTGIYGFPKEEALNIATSEINAFLMKHNMDVTLCIFDEDSFALSGKIASIIKEMVDKEEAHKKLKQEYGVYYDTVMDRSRRAKLLDTQKKPSRNYHYRFSDNDASFVDMVNYYVRILDEKPSEIYKRAWLPRRTFSRIICGNYSPKKDTVFALCLALKLSVEQTVDLLSRNSMAFNPSDPFDEFIYYCVLRKEYDLKEINKGLSAKGIEKRFENKKDVF
ncbi:MAG: macro domain-containing protein [Erysipelotrichaceae bacterium]|nr:macro domain-containing protein [Erysipelotrichaceae bacterium]